MALNDLHNYSDEELYVELERLRDVKRILIKEIYSLDTEIIPLREELYSRRELKRKIYED